MSGRLVGGGAPALLAVPTLVATLVATIVMVSLRPDHVWLSAVFSITTATFVVVGWLITARRPGNVVGPLVLALGLLIGGFVIFDVVIRAPIPPGFVPILALALSVIDGPLFLVVAMLFLHFPTGRIPGPRWRLLVWATVASATLTLVAAMARPGPFPYYSWAENPLAPPPNPVASTWEVAYAVTVLCVAVAAASLFVRWRGAGAAERAQLKWVAGAAVLVATTMITYGAGAGPSNNSESGDLAVGVTLALFPIAIGIAVMRYRLYEIDRIISRTIGWAIVTGVLVAVFAGLVVALQAILAPVTEENTLAVAASTLVAFALFQPLRRRVQRAVDRRFDRARYDGELTVTAFGSRLRERVELTAIRGEVLATVDTVVRPSSTGLWLRGPRSGATR